MSAQRKRVLRRNESTGDYDAIRIGDDSAREAQVTRWGLWLVVFMRVVALVWIVQGLVQWRVVLFDGQQEFEALSMRMTTGIGFFAVVDLVAAVGLWLATPWGGVIWLFAAAAQVFVALAAPRFFAFGLVIVACDAALILGYFGLTYMAGREPDQAPGA